jgi:Rod binding domain-containing protein
MLAALDNSTARRAATLASPATTTSGAGTASQDAQDLRTVRSLGRRADAQDPRVARQAAAQMLSELFFGPMLAEMRQFPFGRELATGGRLEATFGAQLDQRLADTVAGSSTALVRQVLHQMDTQIGGGATDDAAPTTVPGQDRTWWPAQTATSDSSLRGAA